jgi:hypothetical protein
MSVLLYTNTNNYSTSVPNPKKPLSQEMVSVFLMIYNALYQRLMFIFFEQ